MRPTKLPSWIERALGLGARPVPPHVFAIDERSLVYAGFESPGRGSGPLELRDLVIRELPTNFLAKGPVGGSLREPEVVEQQLASLLAEVGESIDEASLVVPDTWVRQVFVETAELPRSARARDDALRWKLKQEVPFKVEELRVQGIEVGALEGQEEPRRVLVGFAAEQLLAGLEKIFRNVGIRIGHISNVTSSFASAVAIGTGGEAFLWGGTGSYALVVLDGGEPLLVRSKRFEIGLEPEVVGAMVERELSLTLVFLADRAPGFDLERLVVGSLDGSSFWVDAARRGVADAGWAERLEMVPLRPSDLESRAEVSPRTLDEKATSWSTMVPLVGAATRSVA